MLELSWLEIYDRLQEIAKLISLPNKIKKREKLEKQTTASDFWQNQELAKNISQELEGLTSQINNFKDLEKKIKEAISLEVVAQAENDQAVLADLEKLKNEVVDKIRNLEDERFFKGKYDNNGVILSIHAGTGGIDAQDWAQMLERMYLRFSEKMNWSVKLLDKVLGQEAGIKSVLFKISGYRAYGWLKSEHGVHRLGRISPFDGEGLRQTSFALVEVIPDLDKNINIDLKEEEIKIDVYRSSGPGGQSVNTTDSAVRITHLPTGLVVACQSERSQHQNKENAWQILKAKLYKLKEEEKEKEANKLKGKIVKAEWGRQIRSYILYGNRLVKDHRSQWEEKDPDKVLAGDLKAFILAYLRLEG